MRKEHNINFGIKIRKTIVFILFIFIITLPLLEYVLNISSEYENVENRKKAPLPKFDLSYLDAFPTKFENYFNDNHNFRGDLLLLNSKFKYELLNISPNKKIVEGKEGWLFLKKYIEPYINERLFTNLELDSFYNIFSKRSKLLQEKGIKQYLAIVPNKCQIYPEFLPDSYVKSKLTKTEQFIETVENISNLNVIYLKDALLSAKDSSPYNLFYKTDQHWNEYGGFIGLKKIISEIKKDFSDISLVNVNNFILDVTNKDGLGLAKMMLLQKTIKDQNIKLTPNKRKCKKIDTVLYPIPKVFPYKRQHQVFFNSSNKKLPKALIIRDSFTNAIEDKLPESFSNSTLIWDVWCYELNEDIINNEKPDIFLTIIIETNLPFIIYKHHLIREDGYNAIDPQKII